MSLTFEFTPNIIQYYCKGSITYNTANQKILYFNGSDYSTGYTRYYLGFEYNLYADSYYRIATRLDFNNSYSNGYSFKELVALKDTIGSNYTAKLNIEFDCDHNSTTNSFYFGECRGSSIGTENEGCTLSSSSTITLNAESSGYVAYWEQQVGLPESGAWAFGGTAKNAQADEWRITKAVLTIEVTTDKIVKRINTSELKTVTFVTPSYSKFYTTSTSVPWKTRRFLVQGTNKSNSFISSTSSYFFGGQASTSSGTTTYTYRATLINFLESKTEDGTISFKDFQNYKHNIKSITLNMTVNMYRGNAIRISIGPSTSSDSLTLSTDMKARTLAETKNDQTLNVTWDNRPLHSSGCYSVGSCLTNTVDVAESLVATMTVEYYDVDLLLSTNSDSGCSVSLDDGDPSVTIEKTMSPGSKTNVSIIKAPNTVQYKYDYVMPYGYFQWTAMEKGSTNIYDLNDTTKLICDTTLTDPRSTTTTFTAPDYNVQLYAPVKRTIQSYGFVVATDDSKCGTIDISSGTLEYGQTQTMTYTPANGYAFVRWEVEQETDGGTSFVTPSDNATTVLTIQGKCKVTLVAKQLFNGNTVRVCYKLSNVNDGKQFAKRGYMYYVVENSDGEKEFHKCYIYRVITDSTKTKKFQLSSEE